MPILAKCQAVDETRSAKHYVCRASHRGPPVGVPLMPHESSPLHSDLHPRVSH
jgi:hypothetical protein